jgi:hypothetical protein
VATGGEYVNFTSSPAATRVRLVAVRRYGLGNLFHLTHHIPPS